MRPRASGMLPLGRPQRSAGREAGWGWRGLDQGCGLWVPLATWRCFRHPSRPVCFVSCSRYRPFVLRDRAYVPLCHLCYQLLSPHCPSPAKSVVPVHLHRRLSATLCSSHRSVWGLWMRKGLLPGLLAAITRTFSQGRTEAAPHLGWYPQATSDKPVLLRPSSLACARNPCASPGQQGWGLRPPPGPPCCPQ